MLRTIMINPLTGAVYEPVEFEATEHAPDGFDREWLGLIPLFLNRMDVRPAAEQLNDGYMQAAGCGYNRGYVPKFERVGKHGLKYPGDPALQPWAIASINNETVCYYESSWVAVFQQDGSFIVDRMD